MCERSAEEDDFCAHLLKFPLDSPAHIVLICVMMMMMMIAINMIKENQITDKFLFLTLFHFSSCVILSFS